MPQGQHQGPKAAAADAVVAAEAGRVDVGAGAEQQVHQIAAARFHGVVQRPPAQVVATVGELPVGAQQPFHGGHVAGGQRGMDRVAAARRREPAAQFPAQVVGHPVMTAVDGHLQQGVVAIQRVAVGQIGARGHQQAHRVQMPLAHREVQRRHVPEARPDKRRDRVPARRSTDATSPAQAAVSTAQVASPRPDSSSRGLMRSGLVTAGRRRICGVAHIPQRTL